MNALKTIFGIVLILMAATLFLPDQREGRMVTLKKDCHAKMLMIQGAVELYNMEKGSVARGIDIEALHKAGYLNQKTICSASGATEYVISVTKQEPLAVEVTCGIHGDVTKQNGEHKHMGDHVNRSFSRKMNDFITGKTGMGGAMVYFIGGILAFLGAAVIYSAVSKKPASAGNEDGREQ